VGCLVQAYRHSHSELGRQLHGLIEECRGLPAQYRRELERLTVGAEAAARLRHLRLYSIADADIPKIGPGRVAILAAHGIFTAADVEWERVRAIRGFGDALTDNLMTWKRMVESNFRFDPRAALSPADQRAAAVAFRARQKLLLTELDRGLAKLESLEPACRAALQALVPRLRSAIAAWEQADADLRLIRRKR
jgi:DNA-binding helix-hairpin-helix protein with protein kinase domain